jgi:hypothetical protein
MFLTPIIELYEVSPPPAFPTGLRLIRRRINFQTGGGHPTTSPQAVQVSDPSTRSWLTTG